MRFGSIQRVGMMLTLAAVCPLAQAMEHVTLRNGFELDCVRREADGDRVRLYLAAGASGEANFLEVAADAVVSVEQVPDPPKAVVATTIVPAATLVAEPTPAEMREMLAHAGAAHNIDADLLASVVRAESGGQVRAVSRTGARVLREL